MTPLAGVCAYAGFAFAATGLGALLNGGLHGSRSDKLAGLGLLAIAGGLGELTSRLAS